MYPYIRCFCGRSLGDLYSLYLILRHEAYIKALGEDNDMDPIILAITEGVNVNMEEILDQLMIFTDCCRGRMITQVQFKEVY